MGFAGLFSTSAQTYSEVVNKQIGQSGANSFALSGDVAGNVNVSSSDPQVALAAINASNQNQITALETLRAVTERFSGVAETSVAGAQNTALNALPLTPEQITASRGDAAQTNLFKFGAAILVAVVVVVIIKTYHK